MPKAAEFWCSFFLKHTKLLIFGNFYFSKKFKQLQCKKDKRYIEKGKDDKFRKDVDDLIAAMEKVEKFRKDVSTVMIKAVGCAGWFWKEYKINDVITGIDERTIRKVTKIINGGDNELDDRIKYTKLFAKILNYENCTNH